MINKLGPVTTAFALGIIAFTGHLFVASMMDTTDALALLSVLYASLFAATVIIILILKQIMKRNIDNVGYTFMLLTSIKMVIVYLVFKTFAVEIGVVGLSKGHLISAFFIMLGVETFCTIRMINKN